MAFVRRQLRADSSAWAFADQGFSSLSNFGLSVVAARQLSAEGFGRLSAVVAFYYVLLALSRAVASEPYVIYTKGGTGDDESSIRAFSVGIAVLVGLAGTLAVSGAALVWPTSRALLLTLAVSFPFLVVQDHLRYVLITTGRARVAAAADAFWFAAFICAVLTFGIGTVRPNPFVLWACAGVGAAIGLAIASRTRSKWRGNKAWRQVLRRVGFSYSVQQILLAVWFSGLCLIALGALGSARGAGLRGAGLFTGAAAVACNGLYLANIPKMARLVTVDSKAFRVIVRKLWIATIGILGVAGLACSLLPDRLGEQILGSTWFYAKDYIAAITIAALGMGILSVGAVAIRTMRQPKASFYLVTTCVVTLMAAGLIATMLRESLYTWLVVATSIGIGAASIAVTERSMRQTNLESSAA